jgi:hypothetical protein
MWAALKRSSRICQAADSFRLRNAFGRNDRNFESLDGRCRVEGRGIFLFGDT